MIQPNHNENGEPHPSSEEIQLSVLHAQVGILFDKVKWHRRVLWVLGICFLIYGFRQNREYTKIWEALVGVRKDLVRSAELIQKTDRGVAKLTKASAIISASVLGNSTMCTSYMHDKGWTDKEEVKASIKRYEDYRKWLDERRKEWKEGQTPELSPDQLTELKERVSVPEDESTD